MPSEETQTLLAVRVQQTDAMGEMGRVFLAKTNVVGVASVVEMSVTFIPAV